MLSVARHFGDLDLRAARNDGEDLVFFTVPVLGLVAYPIWLAKVLAIVAVILFVAMVVVARRRRQLSLTRLGFATLAFLAVLVGGAALAWGLGSYFSLCTLNPLRHSTSPTSRAVGWPWQLSMP